ncbi:vesicle transport protein SFT2A [Scaptodrosophila lebanonensis]|uniref:Vesicle transport protein n=1 Tax=Drosophila lebanonensis TaxID=7225 RepID=A0A6J2TR43_DROLE|nr:vesicle transport protein SFT2A [Scaptodrosophila lebanonensis]
MDKLRRVLSGDEPTPEEESSIITQINDISTLSWSTRIKAFCACFVLGILLSFLGSLALFLHRGIVVFAVFYTLGNIISMASTCFLMGPFKQIKKMFAETRLIATSIVLVSIVMTFVAAIVLKKAGLTLIFIIIQSLAMTWYSLSYIPYARDAVRSTVSACLDV